MSKDKYAAQKKCLSSKKQLRVWMDEDKYNAFKELVQSQGLSVYSVINDFVSSYIDSAGKQ